MFGVSDKARDYILSKAGSVYVDGVGGTGMCCGSINLEPSIRMGKPQNADNYKVEEINQIKVYLPKDFEMPDQVVIDIKKILWFKSLTMVGWKLI